MTSALLITYKPAYSIMISVVILVITIRLQLFLKPYKDPLNNKVEIYALIAGTVTLFSGVIFYRENNQNQSLNLIILIFIFLVNVKFIVEWFYLFTLSMGEKYSFFSQLSVVLKVLLWKQKSVKVIEKHEIKVIRKEIEVDKIKKLRKRKFKIKRGRNARKARQVDEEEIKDNNFENLSKFKEEIKMDNDSTQRRLVHNSTKNFIFEEEKADKITPHLSVSEHKKLNSFGNESGKKSNLDIEKYDQ